MCKLQPEEEIDEEYFITYGYPQPMDDIREYWRDWKMNNNELLTRIDERTLNIWKILEQVEKNQVKLEKHQAEANGYIRENMKLSTKNATWVIAFRWIIGALVLGAITWLTHLQGVW